MNRAIWILVTALLLAPLAEAQASLENARNELQVWTGGGHGINGSASDTGVWNVGGRFGWLLTDPAGSGFLRGRFEYAVDVVPIFMVFQRSGATYGGGVNPFALKWDFVPRHHHFAPYVDLGGGTLFTHDRTPPATSRINFTTSGAIGVYFLRHQYAWSLEARFMHISNAGITTPNPGINTVQARIAFAKFRK